MSFVDKVQSSNKLLGKLLHTLTSTTSGRNSEGEVYLINSILQLRESIAHFAGCSRREDATSQRKASWKLAAKCPSKRALLARKAVAQSEYSTKTVIKLYDVPPNK